MRARTLTGLVLLLLVSAAGITGCSGAQSPSPASSSVIADLGGVNVEVHKAPG